MEAKADQILEDAEKGSDGSPDLRHGKQHREDQQDEADRSDRAIAVRLGRDTVHGRTMVHRRWRLLLRGSAVRLSLIRATAMRLRSAAVRLCVSGCGVCTMRSTRGVPLGTGRGVSLLEAALVLLRRVAKRCICRRALR